MGVTSIIAILVILVLIVFSALSITTAKADLSLSEKTADATSDFYAADTRAEERLAQIASEIETGAGWQGRLADVGYTVDAEAQNGFRISYDIEIGSSRILHVEIVVNADGHILRDVWLVQPSGEWVPDTGLNLYR